MNGGMEDIVPDGGEVHTRIPVVGATGMHSLRHTSSKSPTPRDFLPRRVQLLQDRVT